MEILKSRILEEGTVTSNGIIKVDTFINQMIDTELMEKIGEEICNRFSGLGITKVVTLESSGIPFACETARRLKVPAVFARKYEYVTLEDSNYQSRIFSYTRKKEMVIRIGKGLISSKDKILIVDDFLANGSAAIGLLDILEQAGAEVVGVCVLIEKGFQKGREKIEGLGIRLESLVTIDSLENGEIKFR